ncbi:MAG: glutathione S-transferase N-terminal domain-containing protein [Solirubrobacterales bacterium]
MLLYTCGKEDSGAALRHPCAVAAVALRKAGWEPELRPVPGYKLLPWTRRGDARKQVLEISGQEDVPVLVTDGGTVVSGTRQIVEWARSNPAA